LKKTFPWWKTTLHSHTKPHLLLNVAMFLGFFFSQAKCNKPPLYLHIASQLKSENNLKTELKILNMVYMTIAKTSLSGSNYDNWKRVCTRTHMRAHTQIYIYRAGSWTKWVEPHINQVQLVNLTNLISNYFWVSSVHCQLQLQLLLDFYMHFILSLDLSRQKKSINQNQVFYFLQNSFVFLHWVRRSDVEIEQLNMSLVLE